MSRPKGNPLATGLAVVLFFSNSVFAHAYESNFWKERHRADAHAQDLAALPVALPAIRSAIASPAYAEASAGRPSLANGTVRQLLSALPASVGTVRHIQTPAHPSGKTIVHIQDVHLNAEAQTNIDKAVANLSEHQQIGLIALEGAFGPVDLSAYQSYPDQRVIRAVGDFFLKENRLSGAAHAAFVGGSSVPPIIGVDQKRHYDENVRAYLASRRVKAAAEKKLVELKQSLEVQKKSTFSASLADFDRQVSLYRDGKIPLTQFAQVLTRSDSDVDLNLQSFVEAARMESTLNFPRVEAQRTEALTALLAKLSKSESESLLNLSIAYKLGQINHTDFYNQLMSMCASHGVGLAHYPAFDQYIHYLLLAQSIDGDRLLAALETVEQRRYEELARTKEERALVDQSRALTLASKLLDFSMTSSEWRQYQRIASLVRQSDETLAGALQPFERFYNEADARSAAITENLIQGLKTAKANTAVLVTGGFHSADINALLEKRGFTVVSFVPKLTQADATSGSNYLTVFAQEKTPLDKLFAGEKLFVAPLTANIPPDAGAAAVALATQANAETSLGSSINQVLDRFNSGIKNADAKKTSTGAEFKFPGGKFTMAVTAGVILSMSFTRSTFAGMDPSAILGTIADYRSVLMLANSLAAAGAAAGIVQVAKMFAAAVRGRSQPLPKNFERNPILVSEQARAIIENVNPTHIRIWDAARGKLLKNGYTEVRGRRLELSPDGFTLVWLDTRGIVEGSATGVWTWNFMTSASPQYRATTIGEITHKKFIEEGGRWKLVVYDDKDRPEEIDLHAPGQIRNSNESGSSPLEGKTMRLSGTSLTPSQHDIVNTAIKSLFTARVEIPNKLSAEMPEYQQLDPKGELAADGVSIYLISGLNAAIEAEAHRRNEPMNVDLVSHPGLSRRTIYIDADVYARMMQTSTEWRIAWAAHELAHIRKPNESEIDVQKEFPLPSNQEYLSTNSNDVHILSPINFEGIRRLSPATKLKLQSLSLRQLMNIVDLEKEFGIKDRLQLRVRMRIDRSVAQLSPRTVPSVELPGHILDASIETLKVRPVIKEKLREAGIKTIGDLIDASQKQIHTALHGGYSSELSFIETLLAATEYVREINPRYRLLINTWPGFLPTDRPQLTKRRAFTDVVLLDFVPTTGKPRNSKRLSAAGHGFTTIIIFIAALFSVGPSAQAAPSVVIASGYSMGAGSVVYLGVALCGWMLVRSLIGFWRGRAAKESRSSNLHRALVSGLLILVLSFYARHRSERLSEWTESKSAADWHRLELAVAHRDLNALRTIADQTAARHARMIDRIARAKAEHSRHVDDATQDSLSKAERYAAYDGAINAIAQLRLNELAANINQRLARETPIHWSGVLQKADQVAQKSNEERSLAEVIVQLDREIQREKFSLGLLTESLVDFRRVAHSPDMDPRAQELEELIGQLQKEVSIETTLKLNAIGKVRARVEARLAQDQKYQTSLERERQLARFVAEYLAPAFEQSVLVKSKIDDVKNQVAAAAASRVAEDVVSDSFAVLTWASGHQAASRAKEIKPAIEELARRLSKLQDAIKLVDIEGSWPNIPTTKIGIFENPAAFAGFWRREGLKLMGVDGISLIQAFLESGKVDQAASDFSKLHSELAVAQEHVQAEIAKEAASRRQKVDEEMKKALGPAAHGISPLGVKTNSLPWLGAIGFLTLASQSVQAITKGNSTIATPVVSVDPNLLFYTTIVEIVCLFALVALFFFHRASRAKEKRENNYREAVIRGTVIPTAAAILYFWVSSPSEHETFLLLSMLFVMFSTLLGHFLLWLSPVKNVRQMPLKTIGTWLFWVALVPNLIILKTYLRVHPDVANPVGWALKQDLKNLVGQALVIALLVWIIWGRGNDDGGDDSKVKDPDPVPGRTKDLPTAPTRGTTPYAPVGKVAAFLLPFVLWFMPANVRAQFDPKAPTLSLSNFVQFIEYQRTPTNFPGVVRDDPVLPSYYNPTNVTYTSSAQELLLKQGAFLYDTSVGVKALLKQARDNRLPQDLREKYFHEAEQILLIYTRPKYANVSQGLSLWAYPSAANGNQFKPFTPPSANNFGTNEIFKVTRKTGVYDSSWTDFDVDSGSNAWFVMEVADYAQTALELGFTPLPAILLRAESCAQALLLLQTDEGGVRFSPHITGDTLWNTMSTENVDSFHAAMIAWGRWRTTHAPLTVGGSNGQEFFLAAQKAEHWLTAAPFVVQLGSQLLHMQGMLNQGVETNYFFTGANYNPNTKNWEVNRLRATDAAATWTFNSFGLSFLQEHYGVEIGNRLYNSARRMFARTPTFQKSGLTNIVGGYDFTDIYSDSQGMISPEWSNWYVWDQLSDDDLRRALIKGESAQLLQAQQIAEDFRTVTETLSSTNGNAYAFGPGVLPNSTRRGATGLGYNTPLSPAVRAVVASSRFTGSPFREALQGPVTNKFQSFSEYLETQENELREMGQFTYFDPATGNGSFSREVTNSVGDHIFTAAVNDGAHLAIVARTTDANRQLKQLITINIAVDRTVIEVTEADGSKQAIQLSVDLTQAAKVYATATGIVVDLPIESKSEIHSSPLGPTLETGPLRLLGPFATPAQNIQQLLRSSTRALPLIFIAALFLLVSSLNVDAATLSAHALSSDGNFPMLTPLGLVAGTLLFQYRLLEKDRSPNLRSRLSDILGVYLSSFQLRVSHKLRPATFSQALEIFNGGHPRKWQSLKLRSEMTSDILKQAASLPYRIDFYRFRGRNEWVMAVSEQLPLVSSDEQRQILFDVRLSNWRDATSTEYSEEAARTGSTAGTLTPHGLSLAGTGRSGLIPWSNVHSDMLFSHSKSLTDLVFSSNESQHAFGMHAIFDLLPLREVGHLFHLAMSEPNEVIGLPLVRFLDRSQQVSLEVVRSFRGRALHGAGPLGREGLRLILKHQPNKIPREGVAQAIANEVATALLNRHEQGLTGEELAKLVTISKAGLNTLDGSRDDGFMGLRAEDSRLVAHYLDKKLKDLSKIISEPEIWPFILQQHSAAKKSVNLAALLGGKNYVLTLADSANSNSTENEKLIAALLAVPNLFVNADGAPNFKRRLILVISEKEEAHLQSFLKNAMVQYVVVPTALRDARSMDVEAVVNALHNVGGKALVSNSVVAIPEGVDQYDLNFLNGSPLGLVEIAKMRDLLNGIAITDFEISNMMEIYRVIQKYA